jgi:hypothetical protein
MVLTEQIDYGRLSARVPGIKRGWDCTKNSRQRRHVQRDLPLKTPQRGSGKSEPSVGNVRAGQWNDASLRQPPPAAPAKDGFGKFTVNAACCVDLF